MEDVRNLVDVKAFICSKVTGHLADENDLYDAVELIFKKSGGYFVYMASIAGNFEGDKKRTMADLEGLSDGPDGVYCRYFARILENKQEDVTHLVDKVSMWYDGDASAVVYSIDNDAYTICPVCLLFSRIHIPMY